MPDFSSVFEQCQTHAAVDAAYKEAYVDSPLVHDPKDIDDLQEYARRAHVRIVDKREHPDATVKAEKSTEGKINRGLIRTWAQHQGIPLGAGGRVIRSAENKYREAHELPLLPHKSQSPPVVSVGALNSEIRKWAIGQGMTVGVRGRLHSDVIAKYAEAHREQE